jgi:folate-binding protein YgfZ
MPVLGVPEGVRRIRARAGYSRVELFGIVEIEGPDAGSFLESQIPLRVGALEPGHGGFTAYLDARGRVTHDLLLLRLEDRFWILTRLPRVASLLEKIERYHFRERFTARDRSGELAVLELHGPAVPEILARSGEWRIPAVSYAHLENRVSGVPARFVVNPWSGNAGGHLVVPREAVTAAESLLIDPATGTPLPRVDESVLEILRIEGGRPEFGVDMDERTLLPELGRPEMVSYDKGCYLGQETVARVHARGHVNRLLLGLEIEGTMVPEPGTVVVRDDAPMGVTRSACRSPCLDRVIALAVLRTKAADPGATVHLRMPGSLVAARVRALPLYRVPGPREAAESLYREGLDAFKQDRFEDALRLFERATLMNPHHLDAFESMGICYERLGRGEEAAETMEALTRMAPDHIMAWTNLSRYQAQAGRIEEAEKIKGHVTYLVWKREAGGKAAERKALEDEAARRARLQERVGLFEQVLTLDPDDVVANFGLGKTLHDLERWEEAVPRLLRAVEIQPSYSMAYSLLGTCLCRLEKRAEAEDAWRRGISEATRRGDLMPRRDMERKLAELAGLDS